ncbi:MAG TPA: AAA family ATPase, partial [Gammaproteobacteria bacterium]
IGGSNDEPIVNSTEKTIEYAVKMRQFPNSARLDRVLERGELSEPMVRDLARQVARFHAGADASRSQDDKQRSEQRFIEISENFDCLEQLPDSPDRNKLISELRDWSMESLVLNGDQLRRRRQDGFVRECHGDMHLENLALLDGRIVVFDALEFSESLRWTDVLCEVAFMVMDFLHRKRPDLASVFLSTYLEVTGDYEGLTLARHYLVYRALVRAKVSAFRYYQLGVGEDRKSSALRDVDDYLRLARHCTRVNRHPFLIITCGPSGAGKSYLSDRLCGMLGAIRIRSDTERRRRALPEENRYSAFARHRTYMRIEANADKVLYAGFPVIVDATFIRREYRSKLWHLANDRGVPFGVLWITAPADELKRRVTLRSAAGTDASEADVSVLEKQLQEIEPLSRAEREFALEVDTSRQFDPGSIERFVRRIQRLPLEHRFRRHFRG